MKPGANFEDRNRIRELAEEGKSAEEISQRLAIDLKAVIGHLPKPEAETKAKGKAKAAPKSEAETKEGE